MKDTRFLRSAVGGNALFSAASGLTAFLYAASIAESLNAPAWVLTATGAVLVGYGAALGALAGARKPTSKWAVIATGLDVVWVVGSGALLVVHSVQDVALVALPALCVFTFALLQLEGLRRATFREGTGHFAIERVVQAQADQAWAVVSDVGRYAEVAGTLHRSDIVSGSGLGMVRKCEDKNGVCWTETCARWEPGRAYAFEVDTSAPKYPLPLRAMRGDFEVDPLGPTTSTIRVRLTFKARGRWFTEALLGATFAARGDSMVGAILERWAARIESGVGSRTLDGLEPELGGHRE